MRSVLLRPLKRNEISRLDDFIIWVPMCNAYFFKNFFFFINFHVLFFIAYPVNWLKIFLILYKGRLVWLWIGIYCTRMQILTGPKIIPVAILNFLFNIQTRLEIAPRRSLTHEVNGFNWLYQWLVIVKSQQFYGMRLPTHLRNREGSNGRDMYCTMKTNNVESKGGNIQSLQSPTPLINSCGMQLV